MTAISNRIVPSGFVIAATLGEGRDAAVHPLFSASHSGRRGAHYQIKGQSFGILVTGSPYSNLSYAPKAGLVLNDLSALRRQLIENKLDIGCPEEMQGQLKPENLHIHQLDTFQILHEVSWEESARALALIEIGEEVNKMGHHDAAVLREVIAPSVAALQAFKKAAGEHPRPTVPPVMQAYMAACMDAEGETRYIRHSDDGQIYGNGDITSSTNYFNPVDALKGVVAFRSVEHGAAKIGDRLYVAFNRYFINSPHISEQALKNLAIEESIGSLSESSQKKLRHLLARPLQL